MDPTTCDNNRAREHLNGAPGDEYTGRRFGSAIALHRMRSPRGVTKLALVCDCGSFFDMTLNADKSGLAQQHACGIDDVSKSLHPNLKS